MRNVLIAAAALVALAGPAQAAPKHKWFILNYATGVCEGPKSFTPEEFYNITNAANAGTTVDRIGPENVDKDDHGEIHVHMTGTYASGPVSWDLFTSIEGCNVFAAINNVKPEQAPSGDIN
jgi:hypothetical protein